MPSSAAAGYHDVLEGKLIAAVSTSTTTGVTVRVRQVNGSTPTWPTVAHRLKVIQRDATTAKAEIWAVAAGTTQSGQTVTLGTITRALSLSDGTNFTGSAGTAQSFRAGADVFLAWDVHDASMTPKTDIVNTFTTHQLISSTNELRFADTATAVWDDGTDLNFKSSAQATRTLSQLASLSGSNDKVKVTSNDTTENYLFSKLAAGAGITISETNDGGDEDATIAAVNTVATGHTGLSTVTAGGLLIGAGTSNMTIIGPGSANQLPTSNGTTIAMANPKYYDQTVFMSAVTSADGGASSTSVFALATHQYTISANDLVAGVAYEFEFTGQYLINNSGGTDTLALNLDLGGVNFFSFAPNTDTGGEFIMRGSFFGTAAAGAAAEVRGNAFFYTQVTAAPTGELVSYHAANCATNGTLLLKMEGQFGASDASNFVRLFTSTIRKVSTTSF